MKFRRRKLSPPRLRLIETQRTGVNARNPHGLGHAFRPYRVVAGDDGCAIGGREWCQWWPNTGQASVPMDVRKQRFHAGDEGFAIEQLSDRDGCVERTGIA